jgi:hypothetical protein
MIFGEPFETPFDMPPATIQYKTYSLDAIMANVSTVPYESDVILQSRDTQTYSVDAIMEDLGRVLYESDLLLAENDTQTYQMAGRIKSDLHLSFYVMDGAVAKCNVRANYRMGGMISNARYSPTTPQRTAFSARQSLIFPEDVNADDRFDLTDRRVSVAANKKNALK